MPNKSDAAAKPITRRPWPLWAIALVIGLYAVLWSCLAYPYRQFPSDDRRFWSYMGQGSLLKSDSGYEPVAEWTMRAFFRIASKVAPATPCVMGFYPVACYVGTMAALAFLARRITGNWLAGLFTVLLFALCAWPVTYMFMFEYSPLMVLGAWLGWALLASSLLKEPSRRLLAILAGLAFLAGLGCSAAGMLSILGAGWLVAGFVRHPITKRWSLRGPIWFSGTLLIGAAIFWFWYHKAYRVHVQENVHDLQFSHGFQRYGFLFDLPVPSAVWLLWTYSKTLAAAFVAVSLVVFARSVRNLLSRTRPRPDPLRRFLAVLCAAIWSEALLIDVLPTSKLGRHHFIWFPGTCLLIALTIWWLASLLQAKYKPIAAVCAALIVILSGIEGISRSAKMREEKMALPVELAKHHQGVKILFVFAEDPYAKFLQDWLAEWRPGTNAPPASTNSAGALPFKTWALAAASPQDLFKLVMSSNSEERVLLVGPTGEGSGRSILQHGCLPDFTFPVEEFARQSQACMKTLPYYAFNPAFCLEGRVTQGLLYYDRLPDPSKDPSKNLHLLYWPARSEAEVMNGPALTIKAAGPGGGQNVGQPRTTGAGEPTLVR